MPAWLVEHLEPLRQAQGVIVVREDGKEFQSGFARQVMHKANSMCSIKGITPHRLRGTFATLLSEAGVPVQTIQRVMRHKSPVITMGYLEKNLDLAARAQDQIGANTGMIWRESGA
jgi:integrase/recombinase XerC